MEKSLYRHFALIHRATQGNDPILDTPIRQSVTKGRLKTRFNEVSIVSVQAKTEVAFQTLLQPGFQTA